MRAKRLGCVFSAKKLSPLEMSAQFSRASVAGCETHSGPAALALIIAIETFRAASRAAL